MIERRYFLVIIDSTGRTLRRVAVSRQILQSIAGGVLAFVLVGLALLAHGMASRSTADEARGMQRENEELRSTYAELLARLPHERMLALQSDLTFAQLWAKSGLGLEPRTLGVGPLEQGSLPDLSNDNAGDSGLPWPSGTEVLAVEPHALPLELDRIDTEAKVLDQSLGEMVEYFHDASLLLSNTPSVRPVNAGFQTSSFGKRKDPFHGGWVMHKGLDIGGQIGMEVAAPADGVVIWTGFRGGYGQVVVIDHGYGLQTHYAHLSKYRCKKGDHVKRGDIIAEMGSTGRSTGPHLHYEVRRFGEVLNPVRFILD
jgi:murein DD-endopeptidase MepM/ murein hydrolase activator NlpD